MGHCGGSNDENDYEVGRKEERAAVVTWLRQRGMDIERDADSLSGRIAAEPWLEAADDIQKGEHIPKPLTNCGICGAAIHGGGVECSEGCLAHKPGWLTPSRKETTES
jgi:hypothetical protein